jgi:hypothetical protein
MGPQCLLQSFGWLFILAVKVPAPKGRIRLVGGGLVLSNMAVKVLAPGGSPTGSIKRSWHSQCAGGRGPNRPKVS